MQVRTGARTKMQIEELFREITHDSDTSDQDKRAPIDYFVNPGGLQKRTKFSVNVIQHDIDRAFLLESQKSPFEYALRRFLERTCKIPTEQIVVIHLERRIPQKISFIVTENDQEYYGTCYITLRGVDLNFFVRTYQFDKIQPGEFTLLLAHNASSIRSVH